MVETSKDLLVDLHIKFILSQDEQKDKMSYWTFQHLKMNGVFWGISAMNLLGHLDKFKREDVISFVLGCWNSDGGFGGNAGQDSHMLYTLSAIQLLCLFDALDVIDTAKCARWVASLQLPDGSFQGDVWGEVDTRFVYIAMNCLSLLGRLSLMDVEAAVGWVLRCQNWDGGFGTTPAAESHAGQIFCCLGALRIANALHRVDGQRLAAWLAMRQLPTGGLNGRPEKKADVCYSWWVVASLAMLGRTSWIDRDALFAFILTCQDEEDGGIADKPGNVADVYHTFYGLCGLSLLGYNHYPLAEINPVYAMPYDTLERLGVSEERGLLVGKRGN
ncbi:putative geranylgeranyl transferase type II beta subunit [Trypanosoma theileri]|uniref:Geranylgeranyl transferase type-2 subunit beta n=1 Tax=Trypanosoma theileri TaxID=67003 RepID=A0A1X0PB07_9TRYP|nr:putative geranylgeranyl transferase type II beta subunit [Trypanosoma theileri]ORC93813.1 putative geranylgeranyl transferase type II beta subunit [Trypanosoma theileri]